MPTHSTRCHYSLTVINIQHYNVEDTVGAGLMQSDVVKQDRRWTRQGTSFINLRNLYLLAYKIQ